MSLASADYLLFVGCVAAIYAALRPRGRVILILCASLSFYAISNCYYLILLLLLCALTYRAVLKLSRVQERSERARVFALAVGLNIAFLAIFKYAGGIAGAAFDRLEPLGAGKHDPMRFVAPLGISYFTFQMLACVTDTYRRRWSPNAGFANFVLFGLFFPQISSGPIPRAERLFPQLLGSEPTHEDRLEGIRLIAYGLFKKFVVANRLSEYVGVVFDGALPVSAFQALAACCFNALQLYADFSGYVDIAIGSARLLGIRLDPNFDRPFISTSVTEFWRRWHMTLSFWLRDYLFRPLLFRIRKMGDNAAIAISLVATFAV